MRAGMRWKNVQRWRRAQGRSAKEKQVQDKMTSLGWDLLYQRCLWDVRVTTTLQVWSLGGRSGFGREGDSGTSSCGYEIGWDLRGRRVLGIRS